MKKVIIWLVAGCVFMMPFFAGAATMRDQIEELYGSMPQVFPDMAPEHVNYIAVNFLFEDEVIGGYPDGTFKPDGQINRAELMKMVVGMMGAEPTDADLLNYQGCFPDVGNEWFAYYVCLGKEKGWIQGYPDGTFKPGNNVNRVEAIKIVLGVMIEDSLWPVPTDVEMNLPMPADAEVASWYSPYLRFGLVKDLLDVEHVTGDENAYYYGPGAPMARKEVSEMIYRVWIYMSERVEYADIMVKAACFSIDNQEMSEQEAQEEWERAVLMPAGYTIEDFGKLTLKYGEDDVIDAYVAERTESECSEGTAVDLSKWDGFKMYAR